MDHEDANLVYFHELNKDRHNKAQSLIHFIEYPK
jgi:hypothetical protein